MTYATMSRKDYDRITAWAPNGFMGWAEYFSIGFGGGSDEDWILAWKITDYGGWKR